MPLKSGKSKETRGNNIAEMITSYKESGKIGNTKPRNMKHAKEIASAIAYKKSRDSKKKKPMTEAIEAFIDSFKTSENETFIEGIIKEGLYFCLEALEEPINIYGRTVQYDPAEGKYYEPSKDTYLDHDEYQSIVQADDNAQRKFKELMNRAAHKVQSARDQNKFIQASHLHWNQDSARNLVDEAHKVLGGVVFEDATISQNTTEPSKTATVLDTSRLSPDEIDVVQTELDKVKNQKSVVDQKNVELQKTQQELQKTTQALTVNDQNANSTT